MIFKLCKYLFSKLTPEQLLYFIKLPVIAQYYHSKQVEDSIRLSKLTNKINTIKPTPVVETVTEVLTRFDYQQYERLEQIVSNTGVVSTTSEIEAGFKLGVQHVLQKLRAGYVIPRS